MTDHAPPVNGASSPSLAAGATTTITVYATSPPPDPTWTPPSSSAPLSTTPSSTTSLLPSFTTTTMLLVLATLIIAFLLILSVDAPRKRPPRKLRRKPTSSAIAKTTTTSSTATSANASEVEEEEPHQAPWWDPLGWTALPEGMTFRDRVSEVVTNAAVKSAVLLKQSPLPDRAAQLTSSLLTSYARADAAFGLQDRLVGLGQAVVKGGVVASGIFAHAALRAGVAYHTARGYQDVQRGLALPKLAEEDELDADDAADEEEDERELPPRSPPGVSDDTGDMPLATGRSRASSTLSSAPSVSLKRGRRRRSRRIRREPSWWDAIDAGGAGGGAEARVILIDTTAAALAAAASSPRTLFAIPDDSDSDSDAPATAAATIRLARPIAAQLTAPDSGAAGLTGRVRATTVVKVVRQDAVPGAFPRPELREMATQTEDAVCGTVLPPPNAEVCDNPFLRLPGEAGPGDADDGVVDPLLVALGVVRENPPVAVASAAEVEKASRRTSWGPISTLGGLSSLVSGASGGAPTSPVAAPGMVLGALRRSRSVSLSPAPSRAPSPTPGGGGTGFALFGIGGSAAAKPLRVANPEPVGAAPAAEEAVGRGWTPVAAVEVTSPTAVRLVVGREVLDDDAAKGGEVDGLTALRRLQVLQLHRMQMRYRRLVAGVLAERARVEAGAKALAEAEEKAARDAGIVERVLGRRVGGLVKGAVWGGSRYLIGEEALRKLVGEEERQEPPHLGGPAEGVAGLAGWVRPGPVVAGDAPRNLVVGGEWYYTTLATLERVPGSRLARWAAAWREAGVGGFPDTSAAAVSTPGIGAISNPGTPDGSPVQNLSALTHGAGSGSTTSLTQLHAAAAAAAEPGTPGGVPSSGWGSVAIVSWDLLTLFVDREGAPFRHVLRHLRGLPLAAGLGREELKAVRREAVYYDLVPLVVEVDERLAVGGSRKGRRHHLHPRREDVPRDDAVGADRGGWGGLFSRWLGGEAPAVDRGEEEVSTRSSGRRRAGRREEAKRESDPPSMGAHDWWPEVVGSVPFSAAGEASTAAMSDVGAVDVSAAGSSATASVLRRTLRHRRSASPTSSSSASAVSAPAAGSGVYHQSLYAYHHHHLRRWSQNTLDDRVVVEAPEEEEGGDEDGEQEEEDGVAGRYQPAAPASRGLRRRHHHHRRHRSDASTASSLDESAGATRTLSAGETSDSGTRVSSSSAASVIEYDDESDYEDEEDVESAADLLWLRDLDRAATPTAARMRNRGQQQQFGRLDDDESDDSVTYRAGGADTAAAAANAMVAPGSPAVSASTTSSGTTLVHARARRAGRGAASARAGGAAPEPAESSSWGSSPSSLDASPASSSSSAPSSPASLGGGEERMAAARGRAAEAARPGAFFFEERATMEMKAASRWWVMGVVAVVVVAVAWMMAGIAWMLTACFPSELQFIHQRLLDSGKVADPASVLPPEIFSKVLAHLDGASAGTCLRASRAWHRAITHTEAIWARCIEASGVLGPRHRRRVLSRWHHPDAVGGGVPATFLYDEARIAARLHRDVVTTGVAGLGAPREAVDPGLVRFTAEGEAVPAQRAHADGEVRYVGFCGGRPDALVSCAGAAEVKVWEAVVKEGGVVAELVAEVACEGASAADLDDVGAVVAVGNKKGALHVFSMDTTSKLGWRALHAGQIMAVMFDGPAIITAALDGRVKTIGFTKPHGQDKLLAGVFGKTSTIRDAGDERIICAKLTNSVLAVGSISGEGSHIHLYRRTPGTPWEYAQRLHFSHHFNVFDLGPGALVVQTAREFVSFSWSPLEPLGPESVVSETRMEMRPNAPFGMTGTRAVLVGLGTPVLPLRLCALMESKSGKGFEGVPWRESLALSLAHHRDRRQTEFVMFDLGGEQRRVAPVARVAVGGGDAAVNVTCVASSRHGLIAYGDQHGRVFLASLVEAFDL
ncbi:hypothetical protein HDU96_006497 [Phlyctochytrium bullatum]|nr:hypothetical protein HDU96_006497 [Phlyctochytrium bullatum]